MYLTRVRLNELSRLTGSLQKMHAAIEMAWGGTSPRWRRDGGTLWVVSENEPVRQDTLPGEFDTRDMTPLLERVEVGRQVMFRIRMAPTRTTSSNGGKRGVRSPLRREEDQRSWFEHKADEMGLSLKEFRIIDSQAEEFHHGRSASGKTEVVWALYEGVATIADADKAKRAMTEGIGRQKAYGNGLLTVAPVL